MRIVIPSPYPSISFNFIIPGLAELIPSNNL
jgi:hypothetical protein